MTAVGETNARPGSECSRLALRPCLGTLTDDESAELLSEVVDFGLPEFFDFLWANRLDELWRQFLTSLDLASLKPAGPNPTGLKPAGPNLAEAFAPYLDMMQAHSLQLAAQNLKEKIHLRDIHRLLEAEEIPYFIFKGANLRYTLYSVPTLRSSCDIDLFVPRAQKSDAIETLVGDGFELHVNPQNTSHEVSLTRDGIHLDLHWQLMRPGRTRIDLSDYLFANREPFSEGFQGLNHRASLLVMLIHPAFTKHLASPNSMLIHMVDLYRLLEVAGEAWNELVEILERSGTRTAAWSSLYLLSRQSGLEAPERLASRLQPGSLHRRYLQYWIDHDLIRRWFPNRFVIRTFFSLALQDSLMDAGRAVVRKAGSTFMW